jgi:DNA-binding transcriptional LysR family regulator
MRYNRLDLNMLPALRAVLTERNVTRAAEALHVTQSAMSSILARLREYFDDPLIVPYGRRLELTPLAEQLLVRVNDLLVRVDTTLATKPEFDPSKSTRSFSIVASDYVNLVLLADVLRDVADLAPGVTVEIRQPTDAAVAEMLAGELDFHINPVTMLPGEHPSIELFADTFRVVVDQSNPGVGDTMSLTQYQSLGHVVFRNSGMPLFDRWLAKTHGEPRVEVAVANFSSLAPMVIGTRRIATLHTRFAMKAAELYPIRVVKLDFETPPFVEMLQWHTYRDSDPGMIWMRERITRRARELQASADI